MDALEQQLQYPSTTTGSVARNRVRRRRRLLGEDPTPFSAEDSEIAILLPLLGKAAPPLPPPNEDNHQQRHDSSFHKNYDFKKEELLKRMQTAKPTSTQVYSSSSTQQQQQQQQGSDSDPSSSSAAAAGGLYSSSGGSTAASRVGFGSRNALVGWIHIGLGQYVGFLGLSLMLYVLFLLLPKGVRKAYCGSERRRYIRRYYNKSAVVNNKRFQDEFYNDIEDDPRNVTVSSTGTRLDSMDRPTSFSKPISETQSVQDSLLEEIEERRKQQEEQEQPSPFYTRANSNIIRSRSDPGGDDDDDDEDSSAWTRGEESTSRVRPMSIASSDASMATHQTPSPHKKMPPQRSARNLTTDMDRIVEDIAVASSSAGDSSPPSSPQAAISRLRPSPEHPQIRQIPDERIWRESLRRLSNRGVRLTAHGVQCDPKRIWLTYMNEDDDNSLTWQTEFPRHVQNSETGSSSIVLMRGAVHKIPLANVLYIDVGKKTSALQKTTAMVPPSSCFSLLTQQGSLDLQTNSKLERDAVVSALSYLLDQVHSSDWRKLYQDSNSSTATTSVAAGGSGRETPSTRDTPSSRSGVTAEFYPLPSNHSNAEI